MLVQSMWWGGESNAIRTIWIEVKEASEFSEFSLEGLGWLGDECEEKGVEFVFIHLILSSLKCMRLLLRSQKTGSQAIFLVSGIFLIFLTLVWPWSSFLSDSDKLFVVIHLSLLLKGIIWEWLVTKATQGAWGNFSKSTFLIVSVWD